MGYEWMTKCLKEVMKKLLPKDKHFVSFIFKFYCSIIYIQQKAQTSQWVLTSAYISVTYTPEKI